MHVSDVWVGASYPCAVGAICCQCGGASVEFVHSGMSSMIPPKPRGSGCLVLLVHHLVALRPKHSNYVVVFWFFKKVDSFIPSKTEQRQAALGARQPAGRARLGVEQGNVPKRGNGDHDGLVSA